MSKAEKLFLDQLCGRVSENKPEAWLTYVSRHLHDGAKLLYRNEPHAVNHLLLVQEAFKRYSDVLPKYNSWKLKSRDWESTQIDLERLRCVIEDYIEDYHGKAFRCRSLDEPYTVRATDDLVWKSKNTDANLIINIVNAWVDAVRKTI